jgi:hypothetical protein
MLDALAYLKAARTWSVPAALEVSRSGVGAHACPRIRLCTLILPRWRRYQSSAEQVNIR